jgi:hypothetical protein
MFNERRRRDDVHVTRKLSAALVNPDVVPPSGSCATRRACRGSRPTFAVDEHVGTAG